jgi:serine/threonine protein kinase/Flp pilus assembly protein TadD
VQGICPVCLMALAEEPAEVTTRLAAPVEQGLGSMIGRYKLLEKVGEGGFGTVYVAEQREPVKRRVALKIIKLGMGTKQVIARFEAERQALALMDHPNIAKVFDAGATDAGRPYFVMELVRGIKITDYCEQNNVSTRQRLDLFISVCQAIQHAHQKGVIHRDIKPSNILVTLHDGVPVPKVIDFGIAKATQGELTDKTVYTQLQEFIGTPAYMSPEQAEMSGLDIDTRADIYSLGVLLYELLTGKTPFDAEDLLKAGLEQMRRTIREKEPIKPSTRLSQQLVGDNPARRERLKSAAALGAPSEEEIGASARRLLQVKKLIELLRGDLDWIVMKCLEKDRTRRYDTANGLASDVRRYLNTEPVTARPPSQLYRFQKVIRRNKLAFGAGAAVFAALVIGVGLSTWLFVKERATRQRAQTAAGAAALARAHAEEEGKKARTEAAKSQQVAKLLQDMLQSVGPSVALGRDTALLQEILEKTEERVGKDLANQPEVEAELMTTIGLAYDDLGQESKAEDALHRALDLRRKLPGADLAVAVSLRNLGYLVCFVGRHSEGRVMLEEALSINRTLLGNENVEVAKCLSELSRALPYTGTLAESEAMAFQALAMQKKILGPDHEDVAYSLAFLAELQTDQGELVEAEETIRQALAMQRKVLGERRPETAYCLDELSRVLIQRGKLADAETAAREADAKFEVLMGGSLSYQDEILGTLPRALKAQGRLEEAGTLVHERMVKLDQALGARLLSQPARPDFLSDRGRLRGRMGRWHEAAPDISRALELKQDYHLNISRLAAVLAELGNLEEYRHLCTQIRKRFGVTESPEIATTMAWPCLILPSPDPADAATGSRLADTGLRLYKGDWGSVLRLSCKALAEYRQGRFASAAEWAFKTLSQPEYVNGYPKDDFRRVGANMLLAMSNYQLHQFDEARAALARGLEIADAKLPKIESGDLGRSWEEWVFADMLMHEARGVIEGSSNTRDESKAKRASLNKEAP